MIVEFNSLALRALPPYFIYNEQRENVNTLMRFLCCGYLFNPSVTTCHLPYILLCKTQRRRLILSDILCLSFFPAVYRSITGCCVSHVEKVVRSITGHGREEGICESNFFIYTSYKINYTTDCLMYSNHSRSETIFPERGILTRAVLVLVANFFQESIA